MEPQESILCIRQDIFSGRYMRLHCKQIQRCTVDIAQCKHNIWVMVQIHLLLTDSIPKSDEVSLWIPFTKKYGIWNYLQLNPSLNAHQNTFLYSLRTLHASFPPINYFKIPCTGPPLNVHENQDPCCTILLFHLCLTWTPHRKTWSHASKVNFSGPFPFLRIHHGEAGDDALPSCITSHIMDITPPTHLLIAPEQAMQIRTYTRLQDSLGSPVVLSLSYFMLTGTFFSWLLRPTEKGRGFRLWSTWISMLAPLFSIFVFKRLCAQP